MEIFMSLFPWFLAGLVLLGCTANQQTASKSSVQAPLVDPLIGYVKIPAGCFKKGGEYKPPAPPPQVCLEAFYIKQTEVTQKEYLELMGKDFWTPNCPALCYGLGPSMPAYNVHWHDAVLYSNRLSKMHHLDTVYRYDSIGTDSITGRTIINNVETRYDVIGYRLPTDSEWEYACKAGTHDDFFWGDKRGPSDSPLAPLLDLEDFNSIEPGVLEYAWYFGNAGGKVHPVATKKPNGWGLFDMIGNVSEWTEDWPETRKDSVLDKSPSIKTLQYIRGGSAIKCSNCEGGELKYTSWYREPSVPGLGYGGTFAIGFRIVLPVKK